MNLGKEQEINDPESDEEENTLVTFLKENYTLQDYLNFEETREMLETRRRQKFNKTCAPLLEDFYLSLIHI